MVGLAETITGFDYSRSGPKKFLIEKIEPKRLTLHVKKSVPSKEENYPYVIASIGSDQVKKPDFNTREYHCSLKDMCETCVAEFETIRIVLIQLPYPVDSDEILFRNVRAMNRIMAEMNKVKSLRGKIQTFSVAKIFHTNPVSRSGNLLVSNHSQIGYRHDRFQRVPAYRHMVWSREAFEKIAACLEMYVMKMRDYIAVESKCEPPLVDAKANGQKGV